MKFLIPVFILVAQQLYSVSIISGKTEKYYFGKSFNVFVYDDFLTYRLKSVATASVDMQGKFSVSISNSATERYLFITENKQFELYVQPNTNYSIYISALNPGTVEPVGAKVTIEYTFNNIDSTDINYLDFLYEEKKINFSEQLQLIKNKNIASVKLDTFATTTIRYFKKYNNNYLNDLIKYQLGFYKLTVSSEKNIKKNYFDSTGIRWKQESYFRLLNEYLSIQFSGIIKGADAIRIINTTENTEELKKLTRSKVNFSNDTLNEYALIKFIYDCTFYNEHKKPNIIKIAESLKSTLKYSSIKKIAENFIQTVGIISKGNPIPELKLFDNNGNLIDLHSFSGKYIYLTFFKNKCQTCEEQLKLIPELKKKYSSHVVFISINIDADTKQYDEFLKAYPGYDWPIVKTDNPYYAIELMQLKAAPSYLLINPAGNLHLDLTPEPGLDLEKILYSIKNKK